MSLTRATKALLREKLTAPAVTDAGGNVTSLPARAGIRCTVSWTSGNPGPDGRAKGNALFLLFCEVELSTER